LGVAVAGYEYKKYEDKAAYYVPPFRFPGQYFDEETGFHENWNRYYEPSTGRYLSPEPMLQDPKWVTGELASGHQVPAYSYANNNPIANTDPNGLWTLTVQCTDLAGKSVPITIGPTGGFLPTCDECLQVQRIAATRCGNSPPNVCACANTIARAVCGQAIRYGMCRGRDPILPPEQQPRPVPNTCSPEDPSWN